MGVVLESNCQCDYCTNIRGTNEELEHLRKIISEGIEVYGIVRNGCYHGWDTHQGEYDTHKAKLVFLEQVAPCPYETEVGNENNN